MNFRLPLSFLFNSITAWAVVPEPAKKSRYIPFLSSILFSIKEIKYLSSFLGLGKLKISSPINSATSSVPSWLNGPFNDDIGFPFLIKPFSSFKYTFALTLYSPFFFFLKTILLFYTSNYHDHPNSLSLMVVLYNRLL